MATNPKDQRERFIEAARALGCDEDAAAFDEKLALLAKPKPQQPVGEALAARERQQPQKGGKNSL